MKAVTIDDKIARIFADGVGNAQELRQLARLQEVKNAPKKVAEQLAARKEQLTYAAEDIFEGFVQALAQPNNTAQALQILEGKQKAPVRLPSWAPSDFSLAKSVMKEFLEAQGVNFNTPYNEVIFTDVDMTLVNTNTATLVRNKETGAYLTDPKTGRLMMLGVGRDKNIGGDFDKLKAKYPQIPWDKYDLSFVGEFGSASELFHSKPIPNLIQQLKKLKNQPQILKLINTARGNPVMAPTLTSYLSHHQAPVHGAIILGEGSPISGKMQIDKLSTARRKAVAMAATLLLLDHSKIKTVPFWDDTDDNLKAAMELLPKMFPHIRFEFVDVIHQGNNKFRVKTVAKSKNGELPTMSAVGIRNYKSKDKLFPRDPAIPEQF